MLPQQVVPSPILRGAAVAGVIDLKQTILLMNEKDIEQSLKQWEIDLPEDPRFQSAVWREIAMRDAASPGSRFREALERFMTPSVAIPAASLAAITVLLTATFHGEQSRERTWSELATAYSSAIDPVSHSEISNVAPRP